MTFNDHQYENLMADILHDMKYNHCSNRTKIGMMRQFSEIIVRKLLNVASDQKIMLGNIAHQCISKNPKNNLPEINKLDKHLKKHLASILFKLSRIGNSGIHTQSTGIVQDSTVESMENQLFELYSTLFIKYFLKYPMNYLNKNSIQALHLFSLLPPIIRFKTLDYLYSRFPSNILIVDKLCLAHIKVYDKSEATIWLANHKKEIESIVYPTQEEFYAYVRLAGTEIQPGVFFGFSLEFGRYHNMFDLLTGKIKNVNTSLNEHGRLYSSLEEAKPYYLHNRSNPFYLNDTLSEFITLMDFVFYGIMPSNIAP